MIKRAPSVRNLALIVAFALSSFGLLLFLWSSFGGPVPLQPRPYVFHVSFADASRLAEQADVRISGVSVGRVRRLDIEPGTGRTDAELEIDADFAPRPADTRAILRSKSLLGERFVALSPGSSTAPKVPDGSAIAQGQVSETVELDEVIRTFDPTTRRRFSAWMVDQGAVLSGQGRALSDALGQLQPFSEEGAELLDTLDDQSVELHRLIADGGTTLTALAERPGRLRELVRSADAAFRATSENDDALAEAVAGLGPFLRATRRLLDRSSSFSAIATPLVRRLLPSADRLGPLTRSLPGAAGALEEVLESATRVERRARAGVPALERTLDRTTPVLARLRPFLGQVIPSLGYASAHRRELAAGVGNLSAATQATLPAADGGKPLHYVRGVAPLSPEALAAYPSRLATNRANAYPAPGGASALATGLESFDASSCGSTALPTLDDAIPDPLKALIRRFYFTERPANVACRPQAPLGPRLTGSSGGLPQLRPLP